MPTAHHAVTDDLDLGTMEARLAALRGGHDPDMQDLSAGVDRIVASAPDLWEDNNSFRYFAPLSDAADEYVAWSRNPGKRVYTGIDEFDGAMRGLAPSELMLVVGFAHSGKTVFTTQVVMHNHDKNVVVFSPDETRVLVLIKLFSIFHGYGAEEVEQRLQQHDDEMEDLLRNFASEHFPNLGVFDELSDLTLFDTAVDEYEAAHGKAQLVVIDYAQLITGGSEDVAGTINAIKAWGKRRGLPIILLHQSSRSKGSGGAKVAIDSGGYGGEQQALFLVGVRRKKSQYQAMVDELEEKILQSSQQSTKDRLSDLLDDAKYELRKHAHTITFSLVKNKRPPGHLVDDLDFLLDPATGRVSSFTSTAGADSSVNQTTWSQPSMADDNF